MLVVGFPQDRYAENNGVPAMDEKQDYKLIAFQEYSGKTILEFVRKIDTCDDKDRVLEVKM